MLEKAPDALRADFRRFYGMDFDRIYGTHRLMYWADLAANLPETAVVWRRLDPSLAWTTTQQILANIADATNFSAWTKTDTAYNGGTWHGAIQRPQARQQRQRGFTRAQIDAMRSGHWTAAGKAKYHKPKNK